MALIDRNNSCNHFLVIDYWAFDDTAQKLSVNWKRYASCASKLGGSKELALVTKNWKGSDYPLAAMTTDAERLTYLHDQMRATIGGVTERYDGTELALAQRESVTKIIDAATQFGHMVLEEFAAENVLLGITQAGMTCTVRQNCSEIVSCLSTGSLYDAIDQAKAMPAESKDATFLTDARLLAFVNKIENYLDKPLSTEL